MSAPWGRYDVGDGVHSIYAEQPLYSADAKNKRGSASEPERKYMYGKPG